MTNSVAFVVRVAGSTNEVASVALVNVDRAGSQGADLARRALANQTPSPLEWSIRSDVDELGIVWTAKIQAATSLIDGFERWGRPFLAYASTVGVSESESWSEDYATRYVGTWKDAAEFAAELAAAESGAEVSELDDETVEFVVSGFIVIPLDGRVWVFDPGPDADCIPKS